VHTRSGSFATLAAIRCASCACDREATLHEYLVAIDIEAIPATKRNPNPITQRGLPRRQLAF
jgi:hypothetical protein